MKIQWFSWCLAALLTAPMLPAEDVPAQDSGFTVLHKDRKNSPEDVIRAFEAPAMEAYVLDAGDEIAVNVWGRPELSGKQVIGPDGKITLPLIGSVVMAGKTRDQAQNDIKGLLSRYYADLAVTVGVDRYSSFRVLVLGRVGVPGAITFDRQPTLLDVLTKAASLPIGGVGADKSSLVRCAIFRGRDKVVWVDLKPLLSEGRLDLDIRLARNDVVYLPDANDQLVYVLGYVKQPGAMHLTPAMSFLDAVALAGGPTPDANLSHVSLIRNSKGKHEEIPLRDFFEGRSRPNLALEDGDLIYVPPRWMARFGYFMEKVSPLTTFAVFGSLAKP